MSRSFGNAVRKLWLYRKVLGPADKFLLKWFPLSLSASADQGHQLHPIVTMFQLPIAVIIAFAMAILAVAEQYGAVMELEQAMSPRYFLGSSRPAKRQLNCGTGYHNCELSLGVYP